MLNEHTLKLLDFPRIRERAASYCVSPEGRSSMLASLPCVDRAAVESIKRDVKTIRLYLENHEPPPFSFPDIEAPVKVLSKEGSALELEMLYAIGVWAKNFESMSKFFARLPGIGPTQGAAAAPEEDPDAWARRGLSSVLDGCPSLSEVANAAFGVVDEGGALRDLPQLRRIKDSIAALGREIARISIAFSKNPEFRAALQAEEPTLRDGRTVLALKSGYRGRIKGIVHEVSASGQTIFLEPEELVEKNNSLIQLESRLQAEILKILKETTDRIRLSKLKIDSCRKILACLDIRLARAVQDKRENLAQAGECDSGFQLWQARHPLLGKKAVPIDVDLPEGTRALIVTGPNTGGKTVTLKTVGLLALMNQFGLSLPCAPETKFSTFDNVLADIGDEQSIDQSLSTFSGHMLVMSEIVKSAGPSSLVLLDELGSGTDPEEGCAIAMGLLDYFLGRDSLTIATTHHGILKNYGYTRKGCLNASMEFDSARLTPTYRIVMGMPGQSRALEIASKIGLPADITEAARRYLAEERTDIGEMIENLTQKHREIDEVDRDRRRRLRKAMEVQKKLDLESLKLRQQELELRRNGVSSLKRLLAESRKTLENFVRELRETQLEIKGGDSDGLRHGSTGETVDKKAGGIRTRDIKVFLAELAKSVDLQEAALSELEDEAGREKREVAARSEELLSGDEEGENFFFEGQNPKPAPKGPLARLKPFQGGELVYYGQSGAKARVLRKSGNMRYLIEVGSIRLTVDEKELRRVAAEYVSTQASYQVELADSGDGGTIRPKLEIDLRGERLDEALKSVERQIDAASLARLSFFSIIHGTGEGVLGKGIHEYLKNNPAVETFHFAAPEDGGYGKTIVRLRS